MYIHNYVLYRFISVRLLHIVLFVSTCETTPPKKLLYVLLRICARFSVKNWLSGAASVGLWGGMSWFASGPAWSPSMTTTSPTTTASGAPSRVLRTTEPCPSAAWTPARAAWPRRGSSPPPPPPGRRPRGRTVTTGPPARLRTASGVRRGRRGAPASGGSSMFKKYAMLFSLHEVPGFEKEWYGLVCCTYKINLHFSLK